MFNSRFASHPSPSDVANGSSSIDLSSRGWRDHVLILGAPGAGQTLWARAQAAKVPFLERALRESTCEFIHRASGLQEQWCETRPLQRPHVAVLRSPHHTVSERGLCGALIDGWRLAPGEVSLAHGGVLFLDEAAEFPRALLGRIAEVTRRGAVRVGSAGSCVTVPAEFRLIAATSECPCGLRGRHSDRCRCADAQVHAHLARLEPLRSICRVVPASQWQTELQAQGAQP